MTSEKSTQGSIDYISYLGLGMLALCFGSSFYFTSLALAGLSVTATGAARIVVAAMFLVPLSLATGHGLPRTFEGWVWSSGFGIVAWVLPFLLLVWAQTRIPTNILGAFFAAIPLMILFLSWAILNTKITLRKWVGLTVGSVGLVLLAGPGTLSQIGSTSEYLAQTAVFLATVGFAGGASIGIKPILGVLGVGVFSTGIGQFLRFFLIRRRGPIFILPNGYLTAIITAALGAALLGERPTLPAMIAFAVILSRLVIASDGSGRMKQV